MPHAKVTAYYLLYISFYYKTFSFQKRKNTVHPVADYNSCQSSGTAWMVHCPSSKKGHLFIPSEKIVKTQPDYDSAAGFIMCFPDYTDGYYPQVF